MNVILLNDYAYENGGASAVAYWIVRQLSACANINVLIFAGSGEFDQVIRNLPNVSTYSLNQHDILTDPHRLRAACKGLWNYEAAAQLDNILSEYDPQDTVIHVHSYQKLLTSSCIHMAKKRGFPMVMHLHDYGMICPNLAFYDFQRNEICRRYALGLACLYTNCDARKYIHKLWRFTRGCIEKVYVGLPDCADAYIAVSNLSANLFKPYLPKVRQPYILPTPSFFVSNKFLNPAKKKYFVFIGRLAPEKNPLLLAKCAYELHIPVMFIGEGTCREDILKVNPDAVITGWLKKEQVLKGLEEARCAVFPTLLYETQGLAVEEALSCAIPVIVSDVCAATEVVRHEENGLIFLSNDEGALKTCLLSMLDDDIVARMSLSAKELFRHRRAESDHYIDRLLNIYINTFEKSVC